MTKKAPAVKNKVAIEDIAPADKPADDKKDENRDSILQIFKDMGITVDEKRSTIDLTMDLQKHVMKLNGQVNTKQSDIFTARLNSIKPHTNLTDDEFILRLIMLGIQDRYIIGNMKNKVMHYLFSDSDSKLTDKLIHQKVRFSGINPMSTNELFTRKIKRPDGMRGAED